jgi:hypothetical protein
MRGKRFFIFVSALALVFSLVGETASSQERHRRKTAKERRFYREIIQPQLDTDRHGEAGDHMPPTQSNVELVSRLRLTNVAGGISDVHVKSGFAYVGAWARECKTDADGNPIDGGGTHVIDIRNPANPRKIDFIDAGPNNYVTEGVNVFHVENRFFNGDILVITNEACNTDFPHRGGFDLYDVTNPNDIYPLVRGFGDTDFQFEGQGPEPNIVHSGMGWFVGATEKAYVVTTDNEELDDVDLYDVTDPLHPRLIAETGIQDWPDCDEPNPEPCVRVNAFGSFPNHHDMWVKKVDGQWTVMLSYWDAGWVELNVNDPTNPTFVNDTDYPATDPQYPGISPPEGNGHQGEWNRSGRFFIGTDEDQTSSRFRAFAITTGPNAGPYDAGEFGWAVPIFNNFEDHIANGPVVWGGSGCPGADVNPVNGVDDREDAIADAHADDVLPPLEPGEEKIVVYSRGVCFFSEKIETGQMAGYDVVLIGNHHSGAQNGGNPDAFFCGGQGHVYDKTASGVCVSHRVMHLLFNDTPQYDPANNFGTDITSEVPLGTVGEEIAGEAMFDGWGFVRLFDAETREQLDSYAPAALSNPEFAHGFGDLSVHEVEADPRSGKRLVYAAWYSMGFRVMRYDASGDLRGAGRFIDQGGNELWGIAIINRGDRRPLLALSDRHYGLYIVKYTGPE